MAAAEAAQLARIRQNLLDAVEATTEEWVAAGCPVTFSVDGESYQWNDWLKAKTDEITALTLAIQAVGGSFIVRSRGRA